MHTRGGGGGHPFADRSHRFAVDTLLRRHGFRILERKGNLVPVWERAGQRYSQ
jgi:hypothetical protein